MGKEQKILFILGCTFIFHALLLILNQFVIAIPLFSPAISLMTGILLIYASATKQFLRVTFLFAAARSALGLITGLRFFDSHNYHLSLTHVWPWVLFAFTLFFVFRHGPHKLNLKIWQLALMTLGITVCLFALGFGALIVILKLTLH